MFVADGNEDDVFSIDPENGNVIIARPLDWETRSRYNLSIMATDGFHRIYTEVCGHPLTTCLSLSGQRWLKRNGMQGCADLHIRVKSVLMQWVILSFCNTKVLHEITGLTPNLMQKLKSR